MPVRRTTIRDSWTLAVAKWCWCNRLILPAQADCERSTPTIRKWCRRRRLPLRCVAQSVRFAHAVRRQRRRRHLILLPCNTSRQRFAHTVRRRPRRRRLPLRHAAPRQRCAYPIRRLCWGQHLPLRTAALCQRGAHAIRRRRGCCQLVLCPRRDGAAVITLSPNGAPPRPWRHTCPQFRNHGSHLLQHVAASELAELSPAPALDFAGHGDGTRMMFARADAATQLRRCWWCQCHGMHQ